MRWVVRLLRPATHSTQRSNTGHTDGFRDQLDGVTLTDLVVPALYPGTDDTVATKQLCTNCPVSTFAVEVAG